MDGLKHPAVESAERLENGSTEAANLGSRTRAELKYVIGALAGDGLDWDDDTIRSEVFDEEGSATVSREELVALAEYVADAETEE